MAGYEVADYYAPVMPRVARVGARAFLDRNRTDAVFLGIRIGMFAELYDGRRISTDPADYRVEGPRRGAGALWGSLKINVDALPSLDRELYALDPLAAATRALDADFSLEPEQLEQFIRSERSDLPWSNLRAALAAADVRVNEATLKRAPFRIALDDELLGEVAG